MITYDCTLYYSQIDHALDKICNIHLLHQAIPETLRHTTEIESAHGLGTIQLYHQIIPTQFKPTAHILVDMAMTEVGIVLIVDGGKLTIYDNNSMNSTAIMLANPNIIEQATKY